MIKFSVLLTQKHSITEGEKSVFLLHGFFIRGKDVLTAGEGGHHHDEGGFWKVEIRDDGIDHVPLIARIDIELRPAAAALKDTALTSGLQCADRGRADSDDAAAFGSRSIHFFRSFFTDRVPLLMHFMVFDIFFRNRAEGTDTDMKGDEEELRALLLHFFHKLPG